MGASRARGASGPSRARSPAPLAAALLAMASLAPAGACRGTPAGAAATWSEKPLPAEAEAALRSARAELDAGLLAPALARLWALARSLPDDLDVAVLLQETELLVAAGAREAEGQEPPAAAGAAAAELLERYGREAESDPGAARLVLAARLESDRERALAWLDRALALDGDFAWAHYGRAHVFARLARHREAREALDRALSIDPAHLWARRLDAALRARAGETEAARSALAAWLARAEPSPFVSRTERAEALVDLAILDVLAGDAKEAERGLERAAALGARDPSRLELVRAAAYELRDRPGRALEAAGRAGELDPLDPLPEVQRALLFEFCLGDLEGARDAWRAALERLARPRSELAKPGAGGAPMRGFLLRLQARARLARIEAELARRAAPPSAEPAVRP